MDAATSWYVEISVPDASRKSGRRVVESTQQPTEQDAIQRARDNMSYYVGPDGPRYDRVFATCYEVCATCWHDGGVFKTKWDPKTNDFRKCPRCKKIKVLGYVPMFSMATDGLLLLGGG